MLHAVRVVAIRRRVHVDELAVDAIRGVGFRWVCRCGERGPREATAAEARAGGHDHVADPSSSSA